MEENNHTSQNLIEIPNATVVLVLGIVSLVTMCFCYGLIGAPLGAVGLYLANKAKKIYEESPEKYNNYNNLKIGGILCIVGLILNIICFILIIVLYIIYGVAIFSLYV
jgi:uncharacterized membrane protein